MGLVDQDRTSPLLYDPDFAFPKLRRTLAASLGVAVREARLPSRPTVAAMDRMALAELELSAISLADRVLLARYRGSDGCAWGDPDHETGDRPDMGDVVRVERVARVAHALLDDLVQCPDRLELK